MEINDLRTGLIMAPMKEDTIPMQYVVVKKRFIHFCFIFWVWIILVYDNLEMGRIFYVVLSKYGITF